MTRPTQAPSSSQWNPTTPWVIDAPAQRADLDERGTGETTFTVTNFGPSQNRVMFDIVPGDGASDAWFVVPEQQRLVSAAGSVTYKVMIRVPQGTAPGTYDFTGRAYSADGPPEETSTTSNRVQLVVKGTARPARKINPLVLAAIAGVVLLVLGVTAFFLFRGGDAEGGELLIADRTLAIPLNGFADLDAGTVVQLNGNLQIRAISLNEQFIVPIAGAKLANVGVVANPDFATCVDAPVQVVAVPSGALTPGTVLCVETPQQRMAVITVIAPPARVTNIQYDLFRHKSAG